jgi:hypothetical protein
LEHFLADFGLCIVPDEFGRCTALSEALLEGAQEFAVGFTSVDVTDLCVGPDKELSASRAVIDGGCVRVHVVSGEGFVGEWR